MKSHVRQTKRQRELTARLDKERERRKQCKIRLRKKHAVWLSGFDTLEQKQMLTEMADEHLAPKVWSYVFQTVRGRQARRRQWIVYRAALVWHVDMLKGKGKHVDALTLLSYVATLRDEVPRRTEFNEGEWKLISRALRLRGSLPRAGAEQQAYSVYQHMVATRKLIQGKDW